MPIEGYEELQAIKEQKKQGLPPSTPGAVTPPTPDNTQTGAFGPSPVVSTGENKPGFHPPINQFPETGDPNVLVDWFNSQRVVGPNGEIIIPPESIQKPTPAVKFWLDLGAPQYIGRYAPFEVPTGYKVSGMVEQNNQLLVSFESATRAISPSLMKNLEAFAVQAQQDNPIYMSMTDWIESTFAGKPGLMKSLTDFMVESQQNLWDLQAKEFAETDYGKLLAFSPGARRMYESAIIGGRSAPTFTITSSLSDYDKLLLSSPGAKRMYESALFGGRAPPTFTLWTTTKTKQAAQVEEKPTIQEAYQQYHDVRMPGLLIGESETFYKSIGYPQYGGKYAPFNIPTGATIQTITATPQGLQVIFKLPLQTQTQTAIIGKSPLNVGTPVTIQRAPLPEVIPSLTDWLLSRSKEAAKFEQFMAPSPMKSAKGLETIAGFVASGESLINPRTPFKISPSFIGGYIFGAVVTGYAIGKVVQPIVQPISQALVEPIQNRAVGWLTQSYEKSVTAGELWKPSTTERIVMGITGTTPKQLPPSIIGFPTLIEGGKTNIDLIAYSELPAARATKVGGDISIATYKQLPSLLAAEDIFELTNAPRTIGYGLTVPMPELTQVAAVSSMETFGLPYPALSSIVAKWFTPLDTIPKQELGFSKQPQTFRPAQESPLSFSKQYGAFPTTSGLLQQITTQEAKAVAVSSGMPNVFGPAVTTVQKTSTPFIVANLGEMTSWLVSQETRVKTMESAITPLSISFQPQPRTKQLDETQYLTYPGQPLTVNVPTRETRETVVSPILDLGASNILQGKQGAGTVESLSLLEKQVFQTTQPQKSTTSQRLFQTPIVETETKTKTVSSLIFPVGVYNPLELHEYTIQTPHVTPIITPIFRQDYVPPTPRNVPVIPGTIPVPPKLFDIPRHGLFGLGPREPSSMLYPFGRQKRKYPVMTGGQAAEFLFPQGKKKKRK